MIVLTILAYFAGARIEIFLSRLIYVKKIELRKSMLQFVHQMIKFKT